MENSGSTKPIGKLAIDLIAIADQKTLTVWATDCAEHILYLFQAIKPDDKRPEMAIKAGKDWVRGEITVSEVREAAFASHAAARETTDLSARFAARASGHAAATAHVSGHAYHAVNYAQKAAGLTGKFENEAQWQLEHLKKLLHNGKHFI